MGDADGTDSVEEEDRGAMVVRGSKKQCKDAWRYAQVMLREMPVLLSELREEDIALGALRSLPLSPEQLWMRPWKRPHKSLARGPPMHPPKMASCSCREQSVAVGRQWRRLDKESQGQFGGFWLRSRQTHQCCAPFFPLFHQF